MRYNFLTSAIMTITNNLTAQELDFSKVKFYEHQLEDVMEIIDTTELKVKLLDAEKQFKIESTEINKVRLGIIYHETALNLGFLAKTDFKGYSKKSYDILSELYLNSKTSKELLPFISSYRASALSLLAGETMKLSLVGDAFKQFDESLKKYGKVCYISEFLRGSVAENIPWFFFSKRKYAKIDMQSIIDKQIVNAEFATEKIMSFVYCSWANQNSKNKTQALIYLEKAIDLDPNYKAGRQKAEELKTKLTNKN